ncbi:MAG: hypothetical protein WKF52_03250 [Sphingomicrobium sp.]
MARNNQRGRNNNNPEGHNQFSNGWLDSAKDRPMATAAAAAAAVGAGVFLWSRRNQISEQISSLSDQFTDWAGNMPSGSNIGEFEMADAGNVAAAADASARRSNGNNRSSRSQGAVGGTVGTDNTSL